MFAGGLVDKKAGEYTLSMKCFSSSSAVTGTITNQDNDSTTVTSSSHGLFPPTIEETQAQKPTISEQDWTVLFTNHGVITPHGYIMI